MFRIRTVPFGKFMAFQLANEATGEYATIIPECGGNVTELVLNKENTNYYVIYGNNSMEDLLDDNEYKSSVLLPFPDRIKDGKYRFEGEILELPINEDDHQHAKNGFLCNRPMQVIGHDTEEDFAFLTLKYQYTKDYQGYPFRFDTEMMYSLVKDQGFRLRIRVTNADSREMPLGAGWHPYFKIDGRKIDELKLRIPSDLMYMTDERMIPVEKIRKYSNFLKMDKIGDHQFDSCFVIESHKGIATTELYSEEDNVKIVLWQETGEGKYNYLQIYTPESRNSIVLEPMSCASDAFNNRDGLIILAPGESFEAEAGIRLE